MPDLFPPAAPARNPASALEQMKARARSYPWRILAVVGGGFLLTSVLCCGGFALLTGRKDRSTGSTTGQEEVVALHPYFPVLPGHDYRFSERETWRCDREGVVTVWLGRTRVSRRDYRVRNGNLEVARASVQDEEAGRSGSEWQVAVPKDIREGATWSYTGKERLTVRTCEKIGSWDDPPAALQRYRGRPTIHVREVISGTAGPSLVPFEESVLVYAEGVGLIAVESFEPSDHKLTSARRLLDITRAK